MILKVCDTCGKTIGDGEYCKCLKPETILPTVDEGFCFCKDCYVKMKERRLEIRERYVKDTDNV